MSHGVIKGVASMGDLILVIMEQLRAMRARWRPKEMTIMGLRFLPWPIFWGLRGHWLTRWGSRALCQSSPFLGVLQR
ncbi:hypothetical protein BHE74_00049787 [Ensete ventricosum]|nr:hypothetical protein BHE74_00049787 [Ensete ventricosum]